MKLCYESSGAGRGRLYLHGINNDRSQWADLLRRHDPGWLQAAVDLPGHGGSPALPRHHLFTDYGDALAGWLNEMEAQGGPVRWQLVGHSFGGMVAVDLADRYPERVHSLVLVAPSGIDHPWYHAELSRLPAWPWLRRPIFWLAGTRFMGRMLFSGAVYDINSLEDRHITGLQRAFRKARPLIHRRAFYRYPQFLDALRRIHKRNVPIGLIWGSQDRVVPPADASLIREAAPSLRQVVMGNCGHLPMLEQPEAFYQALQDVAPPWDESHHGAT